MKRLHKILVPTDLSEHSRRALSYGCWLAGEENAALIALHVANEFTAWEYFSEDLAFLEPNGKSWPADRVLAEASLDLSRFLEPSLSDLKRTATATKRVVLGPVPQQIVAVAEDNDVDLIIMSPRRHRGLRRWLKESVTDRVTRTSPCPVLSITTPPVSTLRHGKFAPVVFDWRSQRSAGA
ncbi:MAG TPA: universal stress protein [Candidatus Binatia bacterium]